MVEFGGVEKVEQYVFPFEKMTRGGQIIIYGAGEVGKAYVSQILETGFCSILCVADRQADNYCSNEVRLVRPERLAELHFDYLVIAIKKKNVADAIKKDLEESCGISAEKILWVDPLRFLVRGKNYIMGRLPKGTAAGSEGLSMAVSLGAGFGDAIIGKKVIDTVAGEAGERCLADIYVHDAVYDFVRGLFSDSPYVKNVYKTSQYKYSMLCHEYDIAFAPSYLFTLYHVDETSLRKKQPRFANIVLQVGMWLKERGLSNHRHPTDNALLFARARLKGCNAYTVHSCDGLLPITDTQIHVPIIDEYEEIYKKMNLEGKTFVTVNYGWGVNDHDKEVVPAKIWPLKYYEKLTAMIKAKYPALRIVQIGRSNTPRMQLVDSFVQEADIEVIKYVLRDALLHIDSEGGMVHLATQLGTKCLVAFGPTPVHFFGYDRNINVQSGKCGNCCYLDPDYTKCIRGMKEPECMYSLLPELMFQKFEEYMAVLK